ncbi:uncharacterized protein N7483_011108 [Penicillium malachiteum]|uniref:uncharacterized protein n=1 Tax=Penicillium malachiteum TaxID=1324776 RepID=UPI002546584E|nr:uncharacterized protein N7483_011108 [Penicillium malachiteum]KAJ5713927.1 hypothetical protein N7483_011108 [Penicillium malachiteum]
MMLPENIQKKLAEGNARAASRGFTLDYQNEREQEENTICHKELAPATLQNYENTALNWALWRLSRNEAANANFTKEEPDPTPQLLKSFAEYFIATRKDLPSQKTACQNFINFTSRWERETSRSLPSQVKDDVMNYIRNDLTVKYSLRTKPQERFMVMAKDIKYLLRGLFRDDWHDYKHKRARVQIGSSLALFSGSGSRAGAIIESSSYRDSNKCLYYKSSETGRSKRWVTIDSKFLKGWRHRDDKYLEHPVLGLNFVFWVIVHGVADGAFKGLNTVADVLAVRPPEGRESYTIEMVNPEGPSPNRALTFSSLRHNNTSLAQRQCFRDKLRVHRIRANIANCIDPKASEATRGQALNHQNHNIYLKYQSVLKSLDIQALIHDLKPDYKYCNIEQSIAYHRDLNAPQKLDAATIAVFEETEEIKIMNQRITYLTSVIAG